MFLFIAKYRDYHRNTLETVSKSDTKIYIIYTGCISSWKVANVGIDLFFISQFSVRNRISNININT